MIIQFVFDEISNVVLTLFSPNFCASKLACFGCHSIAFDFGSRSNVFFCYLRSPFLILLHTHRSYESAIQIRNQHSTRSSAVCFGSRQLPFKAVPFHQKRFPDTAKKRSYERNLRNLLSNFVVFFKFSQFSSSFRARPVPNCIPTLILILIPNLILIHIRPKWIPSTPNRTSKVTSSR